MARYYVNKNAQDNGDHEVHNDQCSQLPLVANRIDLGVFSRCQEAVQEAKKHYKQSDGCFFCSPTCNKG